MFKNLTIISALAVSIILISCSSDSESAVDINGSTKKDMVLIQPGTFQMGNTGAYAGLYDEKPIHTVTISKAFYIGKYEVTQKQYQAVMNANPSEFKGDNYPVETVTWYDAVAFCNALSKQEGLTPCYTINGTDVACNFNADGYRLPTEAEWEYACKAGITTDFYNGILTNMMFEPLDTNLNKIAWYGGNSDSVTHPVGQKLPNLNGLYDMSGNVREWCWDWYGLYSNEAATDPKGTVLDSNRVLRGGCWSNSARNCRSSFRDLELPTPLIKDGSNGFRIVSTK